MFAVRSEGLYSLKSVSTCIESRLYGQIPLQWWSGFLLMAFYYQTSASSFINWCHNIEIECQGFKRDANWRTTTDFVMFFLQISVVTLWSNGSFSLSLSLLLLGKHFPALRQVANGGGTGRACILLPSAGVKVLFFLFFGAVLKTQRREWLRWCIEPGVPITEMPGAAVLAKSAVWAQWSEPHARARTRNTESHQQTKRGGLKKEFRPNWRVCLALRACLCRLTAAECRRSAACRLCLGLFCMFTWAQIGAKFQKYQLRNYCWIIIFVKGWFCRVVSFPLYTYVSVCACTGVGRRLVEGRGRKKLTWLQAD